MTDQPTEQHPSIDSPAATAAEPDADTGEDTDQADAGEDTGAQDEPNGSD